MKKIAFDNQLYLELQSEHIRQRIAQFDNKLYVEFGGKLFDDFHASRVLPGFEPDSKVKMLLKLKENVEIIVVISASDIEKNKVRGDLGITYDQDCLRLIDAFRSIGFLVNNVVISHYSGQSAADFFKRKLESLDIKVALHYTIIGYPTNISHIVSENGFGLNDYIETERELVVVTAPGPGSGKMATCLSQLYHDQLRGIRSGYAKFETCPIWNIPLKHPLNLSYEAATADLNDVNMIDPFHLEAYNQSATSYNRDVEVFPVLKTLFEKIYGVSPYLSPTDMGVNMIGHCIIDNDEAMKASKDEIIRRYYQALVDLRKDKTTEDVVSKIEIIMNQANVTLDDRPVVKVARDKAEATNAPAVAIQLHDGTILTGKTSPLLGASSACLLNALKHVANIDDSVHLISPRVIEPVQSLKTDILGNNNPRLHIDEILIALAITAVDNKDTQRALEHIQELRCCEVHSSVILAEVDVSTFKKLGINLTQEPFYHTKKLYHKS